MSAASLAKLTREARAAFLPCELAEEAGQCFGPWAFHHRKLKSAGRDDSRANLLWLCVPHHAYVHANPGVSYERGWLLHSWEQVAS